MAYEQSLSVKTLSIKICIEYKMWRIYTVEYIHSLKQQESACKLMLNTQLNN